MRTKEEQEEFDAEEARLWPVPAEIEGIAVYRDGSGKASYQHRENIKKIADREATLAAQRAFIDKHYLVLAGLSWEVERWDRSIELNARVYRGERVTPAQVAALWPEATWKRVESKWTHKKDEERDWIAEVDGITLRIEGAEKCVVPAKPVLPRCGVVVARGKVMAEQ